MRIDIVSIFPDYLSPLALSLVGKAREQGLLDVRVHDLRDYTHDRHRTVDDEPYGGGPGMVMRPEPWGEVLDAVLDEHSDPLLIIPTPSGRPLTQSMADRWSRRGGRVIACGRYEGIDPKTPKPLDFKIITFIDPTFINYGATRTLFTEILNQRNRYSTDKNFKPYLLNA